MVVVVVVLRVDVTSASGVALKVSVAAVPKAVGWTVVVVPLVSVTIDSCNVVELLVNVTMF